MIIRIATRRSQLALAQSHWIKAQIEALEPEVRVELREYVTRGDKIQNVPLAQVGGKGLFTKEIEDALLAGEADLAVHSLKDLPSELPAGLVLAAVPMREDPRDALVCPDAAASGVADAEALLRGLPAGARVGTSSLRRQAQLLHYRDDLRVETVRGNVDTRLRKLDSGEYDALVLAAAGLRRLGLAHRITASLPVAISTPAPGQGALGLETRESDSVVRGLLQRLQDDATRTCVTAERALMDAIGGGCSIPLGAYAEVEGEALRLTAVVAATDGSRLLRRQLTGSPLTAAELGCRLAEQLRADGADELLHPSGV